MPVVDAHQHFWDIQRFSYPWLSPEQAVLYRNYGPEDLKPEMDAAGVQRSVFVQATHVVDEARWVLRLSDRYPFIAGVVGWVDLTDPDIGMVLHELQQHPRFKGVRHQVHDEPDDRWLLRDDVWRGLEELAARGLTFDLLLFPRHLPHLPEVLEQHPTLRFVIDHLAKPPIKSGETEPWQTDLQRVARYPNVWCKLSGMVTEASHHSWRPEDLKPYVQSAVDLFGYDRLMWGSDWPVCRLAADYGQVKAALLQALGAVDDESLEKILGRNAIGFYSLDVD